MIGWVELGRSPGRRRRAILVDYERRRRRFSSGVSITARRCIPCFPAGNIDAAPAVHVAVPISPSK
jgi:hypothetical protein